MKNALQNLEAGKPLTANQREVLRTYRDATGATIGQRQTFVTASGETRTRSQVVAAAQRNLAAGKALTANQRLALKQGGQTPTPGTFVTQSGATRTAAQVALNAAQALEAGRQLTANQLRVLAGARRDSRPTRARPARSPRCSRTRRRTWQPGSRSLQPASGAGPCSTAASDHSGCRSDAGAAGS